MKPTDDTAAVQLVKIELACLLSLARLLVIVVNQLMAAIIEIKSPSFRINLL